MAGFPYSDDEMKALAEISKQKLVLKNHMHHFPGRSYEALKEKCQRMGILVIRVDGWTEEDDEVLREIYQSNSTIKASLGKRLPRHSYTAAKTRARILGLAGSKAPCTDMSKSVIKAAMVNLLSKGQPMTSRTIRMKLGSCRDWVNKILNAGHSTEFYIADWERVGVHGVAPLWLAGNLPDAPRLPRKDISQSKREYKRRQVVKKGEFNPWAQLGVTPKMEAIPSRVFKQDMTIHLDHIDEMEAV